MVLPMAAVMLLGVWTAVASSADAGGWEAYESMAPQGKRAAYSYVSEYKRLPVYNFGLGKRSEYGRTYSFGLGKREDEEYAKRGKQYSFGLGKRIPYRLPYEYEEDYDAPEEGKRRYAFGLGKRLADPSSNERASRSMHYNFGLGKRDQDAP